MKNKKTLDKTNPIIPDSITEIKEEKQENHIGVLKEIDTNRQTMSIYDIQNDITVKLEYRGGTDIRNQYDQVISATQLEPGIMVEMRYDESTQTLNYLAISSKTWEYTKVTGIRPDLEKKIIELYDEKYRYTSKLYVRTKDHESTLVSINRDDVLTIRGYEKTIYSIEVTKGHGSISLKNAQYFEGGSITIGVKDYTDITEDMVFTVREGKVGVQIEKGDVKKSTVIEVIRDQECVLDLSKFQPEPDKKGEVTFVITPFGAELFIDDALMSYANPIELTYGKHMVEVSLNGYETYKGEYELNQASDVIQIDLPKTKENEESTDDKKPSEPETTPSGENNPPQNTDQVTPTPTVTVTPSPTKEPTPTEEPSKNETTSGTVDQKHYIQIKGPTGASVYINGQYKGAVPLKLRKPLGKTEITFVKAGYEQITHTVDIADDEEDKEYTFPELVKEQYYPS